ncbi:MAG: CotH kinase family protein, partial [Acutalibacteraceae bacterium]
LRNRMIYDLANAVDSKYAPKTSSVELYMDGEYLGSYIITQKIAMGSAVDINTDNDVIVGENINFSFVVEVDANDQVDKNDYFVSNALYRAYGGSYTNGGASNTTVDIEGNAITGGTYNCVTLKDPGESGDDWGTISPECRQFISDKWEKLAEILYNINADGTTHNYTMADLEEVCNVNSLVRTYLINELSKNLDIGVTSTYFTYNAVKGIWYASPVWDFDRGFSNINNPGTSRQSFYDGSNLDFNDIKYFSTSDMVYYGNSAGGTGTYKSLNILAAGLTKNGGNAEIYNTWNNYFKPALDYLAQTENTSADTYVRTNSDSTTDSTRLHYGGYYKDIMEESFEMNRIALQYIYSSATGFRTDDAYFVNTNNTTSSATATKTTTTSSVVYSDLFTGMTNWVKARTAWLDEAYSTYKIVGASALGFGADWSGEESLQETEDGSGVYMGAYTTTSAYDTSTQYAFDVSNMTINNRENYIYAMGDQYLTLDCTPGLNLKALSGGKYLATKQTSNMNLTFTGTASTTYYYVVIPRTGFVGVYKTLTEANNAVNKSSYFVTGTWQQNNATLDRSTPEAGRLTYNVFTGTYSAKMTIPAGSYSFKLSAQNFSTGATTLYSSNDGVGGTMFLANENITKNNTFGVSASGESLNESDKIFISSETGADVTFTYDPDTNELVADIETKYPLYFTAANLNGTKGLYNTGTKTYDWISLIDADKTRTVRAYLYSDSTCTTKILDSNSQHTYVDFRWDTDDPNCYGKYTFVGDFTEEQANSYMQFTLVDGDGTELTSDEISAVLPGYTSLGSIYVSDMPSGV